jgi:hypothetical protein
MILTERATTLGIPSIAEVMHGGSASIGDIGASGIPLPGIAESPLVQSAEANSTTRGDGPNPHPARP